MRDSTRRKHLKYLSFKLSSAIEILKAHYGNKTKVREYINTKLTPPLTESTFSKYIGAHARVVYLNSIRELVFKKVFEILDPFLLDEFYFKWNEHTKKYVEFVPEEISNRLQGLIGTWIGYSWDASTSKTDGDHIHVFKIHIPEVDNIICITQRGSFTSNKIVMIGTDRVSVELNNLHRKIFIVILIGNAEVEDLKRETTFHFAYTDSGNKKVKAGLGIIERTNEEFETIKCMSKPAAEITNTKSLSFISTIQHSQLILH